MELIRAPWVPGQTEKRCPKCRTVKSLDDFTTDARNRSGRASWCRVCAAPAMRAHALRSKYGLTVEDFDRMAAEQDGRCACCGETPPKLVVDHCHRRGNVRALLCDRCNRLLGVADDRSDLLQSAVAFLAAH